MPVVLPVSKALYLCDHHLGFANGKVDLYGIFKAIRPPRYPHQKGPFVCFAQLVGGLGTMRFHIDICRAADRRLMGWTGVQSLHFPDRNTLIQVAITFPSCVFDRPGIYLAELFCDNTWITDTTLFLRDAIP